MPAAPCCLPGLRQREQHACAWVRAPWLAAWHACRSWGPRFPCAYSCCSSTATASPSRSKGVPDLRFLLPLSPFYQVHTILVACLGWQTSNTHIRIYVLYLAYRRIRGKACRSVPCREPLAETLQCSAAEVVPPCSEMSRLFDRCISECMAMGTSQLMCTACLRAKHTTMSPAAVHELGWAQSSQSRGLASTRFRAG